MEHYVTLFDSLFLPQGLALHSSMEQYAGKYTLWILSVDDIAYDVLTKLNLPNVRLIRLIDVETPELKKVKGERTKGEYCWTLTPFAPRFVFETDPNVQRVTYLDADLWFLKSPQPIFDEFEASQKQVLITEHGYAPEYDQSAISGHYCVQFLIFNRIGGETVRTVWEQQCIEWCYARHENGKFGDQKYLDDWLKKFPEEVHVLQHQEWTLAPWNISRFPYGNSLIYHFHSLRLLKGRRVYLGSNYPIRYHVIKHIYDPYLNTLSFAFNKLNGVGFIPKPQKLLISVIISSLKKYLVSIRNKIWEVYKHYYSSF